MNSLLLRPKSCLHRTFIAMDYLKSVVPSQLVAERGSNLVLINSGSANIRVGLSQQETPFNVPHCIARHTTEGDQVPKRHLQDQMLNSQVTTVQHMELEKAYDIMARVDGYNPPNMRKDTAFAWTNVFEKKPDSSLASGVTIKNKSNLCVLERRSYSWYS